MALLVVASSATLLLVLGMTSLFRSPLRERAVATAVQLSSLVGLTASMGMLAFMLSNNLHDYPVDLGDWVTLGHSNSALQSDHSQLSPTLESSDDKSHDDPSMHFHLRLKLVFDRLSIPFLIMSYLLCGVIGAFALRYMHLEPGFHRFFLFYAVFQLGMVMTSLAGTIETLFIGWELVGLSSALLVAFFHDRPAPVQNGLRVWSVYRISDAAFLVAALTLHHLSGSGDFEALMGQGDWPFGVATIDGQQALSVGMLLLIAAAGKSALLPFSGWLPRAMEGPTPSSAVFYGALSVHLGAFLLLRVSPILDKSPFLSAMVVVLGFLTLCFAAMAGRVQTDIKSALAFASLMQVSIIFMEIGLGLRYIALIHIIGHACIRTLQLVRAPSLLKDHRTLENAIGDHLPISTYFFRGLIPVAFRERLYRFALERGRLDSLLDDFIAKPIFKALTFADRVERRFTAILSGPPKADTQANKSLTDV
ncbi:MAG: proton-conducting transporter membrane subunit [Planctomycetota bacterium]|nr:proton-conducting transporter membrane subunit [Planctomycetota bacterium]